MMKKLIVISAFICSAITQTSDRPSLRERLFGPRSSQEPVDKKPGFIERISERLRRPSAEQRQGFAQDLQSAATGFQARQEKEAELRRIEAEKQRKEEQRQTELRKYKAQQEQRSREDREERMLFDDLQALSKKNMGEQEKVQEARSIISRHAATIKRKGINTRLRGQEVTICGMLTRSIPRQKANELVRTYGQCTTFHTLPEDTDELSLRLQLKELKKTRFQTEQEKINEARRILQSNKSILRERGTAGVLRGGKHKGESTRDILEQIFPPNIVNDLLGFK